MTTAAQSRAWRKNNLEKNRAYQRARYQAARLTPQFQITLKLDAARARAKRAGIPFDLTVEDIVIPPTCPVLGIPLVWCGEEGSGPRGNSPALDRIVNEKGYVRGNVQVISSKANSWKSNMTIEDAEKLVAYMKLHEILS